MLIEIDCPRAHTLQDFAPTQETTNAAKVDSDAKDIADTKKTQHTTFKVAVVQGTVPSDDKSSDEPDPHHLPDPIDYKPRKLKASAVVQKYAPDPTQAAKHTSQLESGGLLASPQLPRISQASA